jgi:hypothetical protein
MNTTEDWLPLFPLDLVLLPGALLPLHVFEPRYRALASHVLEGGRPFGVVRMHDGHLAGVGCLARIVHVLQAYPDGRSDILVRGEERFALLDLREHADGYLESRTEPVCDEPGPGPDAEDRLLLERLFRDYSQLADDDDLLGGARGAEDGTIDPDRDANAEGTADPDAAATPGAHAAGAADADLFSFAIAVRMPLGVDERQALLQTMSERERTLALLGYLARLVPRLRAHEKDRRRVRGNGKLVPAEE